METIKFTDDTEKAAILKEQKAKGKFLIETQRHIVGGVYVNQLLFDSKPKPEEISELQALKDRVVALEGEVRKGLRPA